MNLQDNEPNPMIPDNCPARIPEVGGGQPATCNLQPAQQILGLSINMKPNPSVRLSDINVFVSSLSLATSIFYMIFISELFECVIIIHWDSFPVLEQSSP
jgi:hypothetical protein